MDAVKQLVNARAYWSELTDKELREFYEADRAKPFSRYTDVTFEQYIILSAEESRMGIVFNC
jgi:hypothetical protein